MDKYIVIQVVVYLLLNAIIIYQTLSARRAERILSNALLLLGYYRVRFGEVTMEDIYNKVGITDELIDKFHEQTRE